MNKIPNFKTIREVKEKTAFYCSDCLKPNIDLYFSMTNEPVTNPMEWTSTLRMGAGKGVEMEMLKVLKDSDVVEKNYIQEEHGRVDFKYKDITVHGYMDALTKSGKPIEIKSINNKNFIDIKSYKDGKPRENYVGQLSLYQHFLGVDTGYLFVSTVDGLEWFWLENKKIGDMKYQCENVVFDLGAELERWNKLYTENIVPKKLPDIWENVYKIPIEELDLSKYPKTNLKDASAGKKVLGSGDKWKIEYSSWKNRIIELQGSGVGYSSEELSALKEKIKKYAEILQEE